MVTDRLEVLLQSRGMRGDSLILSRNRSHVRSVVSDSRSSVAGRINCPADVLDREWTAVVAQQALIPSAVEPAEVKDLLVPEIGSGEEANGAPTSLRAALQAWPVFL